MDNFIEATGSNFSDLKIKDRIKLIQNIADKQGRKLNWQSAKELLRHTMSAKCFINSIYQVNIWTGKQADEHILIPEYKGKMDYLSIKRKDRQVCRNWSDFQSIKNMLCKDGQERYAIEIYPPEERLVNTANQYHLWVFPKDFDLGIGFFHREVIAKSNTSTFESNGVKFTTSQTYE
tara:strand:- start:52 stop:582 length:531 start_codon:yes stop_codon:yes gene_type:complete